MNSWSVTSAAIILGSATDVSVVSGESSYLSFLDLRLDWHSGVGYTLGDAACVCLETFQPANQHQERSWWRTAYLPNCGRSQRLGEQERLMNELCSRLSLER